LSKVHNQFTTKLDTNISDGIGREDMRNEIRRIEEENRGMREKLAISEKRCA